LGGIGSGIWYRFEKKTTTDESHSVDVRHLHRHGLFKPGSRFSLRWSCAGRETGSIRGLVDSSRPPKSVTLLNRHRSRLGAEWGEVRERVSLEWTPCNFGGGRPWFLCPGAGCGRRVAVLYGPGRYFLWRHCYDLSYKSQREGKANRALRRAQKIRERLGGSTNMMEPFPERPKGMHLKTYMRMCWEHHEAEMEQLAGMREWLDQLGKKVG
jgi:hypothetical protein